MSNPGFVPMFQREEPRDPSAVVKERREQALVEAGNRWTQERIAQIKGDQAKVNPLRLVQLVSHEGKLFGLTADGTMLVRKGGTTSQWWEPCAADIREPQEAGR